MLFWKRQALIDSVTLKITVENEKEVKYSWRHYLLLSFLQTLPRLLLGRNASPSGRLHGGWNNVSLGRDICTGKLTASASEHVVVCRDGSPGMSWVSDVCLPLLWERVSPVVWGKDALSCCHSPSPCGRCPGAIVLFWFLGVCLFEENSKGPKRLGLLLACPFVFRQWGHGCRFYRDGIGGEVMQPVT